LTSFHSTSGRCWQLPIDAASIDLFRKIGKIGKIDGRRRRSGVGYNEKINKKKR